MENKRKPVMYKQKIFHFLGFSELSLWLVDCFADFSVLKLEGADIYFF